MTCPARLWSALIALLLCAGWAAGAEGVVAAPPALVFASASFAATNDLAKHRAVAKVAFTNVSGRTLGLTPVKPSCSCMSITLDAATYAPGEEGVILFTNTFEPREGSATKTIVLVSDEVPARRYQVEVVVTFPTRDDVQDVVVEFDRAAPLTEKRIDIKIGDPADPLDRIEARVDFPVAKAEVYALVPGLYYQVGITPRIAGAAYTCKVIVAMHSAKRKTREYVVYVRVK